jgi:phosphoglycolate phosphatase-like HAD superfamily hydrolase
MDLECARGAGSGFVGVLSGYGNEDTWRSEGVDYVEGVGELPSLLFRQD